MKQVEAFFVGLAALALVALAAYFVTPRSQPNLPAPVQSSWHRYEDVRPPNDGSTVFIAYWTDEYKPSVQVVRLVGDQYFEYQPAGQGAYFGTMPPSYWSEMPDAAR